MNQHEFFDFLNLVLTNYGDKLTDNTFEKTPFLKMILNSGVRFKSGTSLTEKLIVGNSADNIRGVVGDEEWSTSETDLVTEAVYPWVQLVTSVRVLQSELLTSKGPEALFDLVETKIRNLENSFAERLSADAYGSARVGGTDSAPVFSQTQLLGLDDLISDSVAVGGVDPATTPAWKSYMNVDQAWNPENLHHDLRVLVRKTNRGLESHKSFIVCGEDIFDAYVEQAADKIRLQPGDPANLGFSSAGTLVGSTPMYLDDTGGCPPRVAYSINFDSFRFRPNSEGWGANIETNGAWTRISRTQVYEQDKSYIGQFTTRERRALGKLSYEGGTGGGESPGESPTSP